MNKTSTLVTGETLARALSLTKTCVKWLRTGLPVSSVSPEMAALIARASSYEGKVRGKRVLFIREVETRKRNVRDDSFWAGRGCIRFVKQVDRQTVSCWERYFRNKALFRRSVVLQGDADAEPQ